MYIAALACGREFSDGVKRQLNSLQDLIRIVVPKHIKYFSPQRSSAYGLSPLLWIKVLKERIN